MSGRDINNVHVLIIGASWKEMPAWQLMFTCSVTWLIRSGTIHLSRCVPQDFNSHQLRLVDNVPVHVVVYQLPQNLCVYDFTSAVHHITWPHIQPFSGHKIQVVFIAGASDATKYSTNHVFASVIQFSTWHLACCKPTHEECENGWSAAGVSQLLDLLQCVN